MLSSEKILERRRQVKTYLQKINHEIVHAFHVCKLSLELYDGLQSIHKLGMEERFLLECGALLHDIGWKISREKHHKHGLRMIMNADLPAFSEREKRIIANIARYHRKSLPKPSHAPYSLLSPKDQKIVKKLAALLRIADACDTTHKTRIQDIKWLCTEEEFILRLISDSSCEEELEAIEQKKNLFEKEYEATLQVTFDEVVSEKACIESEKVCIENVCLEVAS